MTLPRLALLLAMLAALLLLVAGPGTRFEWWDFRTGFLLMRWSVYIGGAAIVFALVLLAIPRTRRGSVGTLTVALVLGLVAAGIPLYGLSVARSVPAIHDISTDTDRPPAFVDVLPLRADAPNPAEHAGAELAAEQHAAYPDIVTRRIDAPPARTFARAEQAARAMGWEIVDAEPAEGRIEATDTTFFFGFKDDVVIRIEAEGSGSRVDMRSVSRVGKSDVGTNARRIRDYFKRLAATAD